MVEKSFTKDPDAILDYAFDWVDWLQMGESIVAHIVTAATGITKDSDSEANGVVTVWLSGGIPGRRHTVGCKITTNLDRTEERSMRIACRER